MSNDWVNAHNKGQRKAKAITYARIIMEPDNNPVSEVDYLIAKHFLESEYQNKQLESELSECQRERDELRKVVDAAKELIDCDVHDWVDQDRAYAAYIKALSTLSSEEN